MTDLVTEFGQIDIYLFDQLLRGRIAPGMRVVDAGCGGGRNLVYFFRNGFDIFGVDADPGAIASVRAIAKRLAPDLPENNFRVESVEAMSFPDEFADAVLSSAVLHFAETMRSSMAWCARCGACSGRRAALLQARVRHRHGNRMQRIDGRRCLLPDGSERYLVDQAMLLDLTRDLGGRLMDPLKTTIVQDARCMTTWVVRKDS